MGFATGIMLLLSDNRPVWIIPPLLLGLWIQMENASRLHADIALIIDSARHQLITYILIAVASSGVYTDIDNGLRIIMTCIVCIAVGLLQYETTQISEERRVGKGCVSKINSG